MNTQEQAGTWVTIAEAAPILGCSVDTVRRRLKRGEVQARLVHTQHGPTWEVCLGNVQGDMPTVGTEPRQDAQGVAEGPSLLEAIRLVSRLQEENRNLAGQVGYLQAQLEQARGELRALQAPHSAQEATQGQDLTAHAPDPITATSTPWWRRWRAWAAIAL